MNTLKQSIKQILCVFFIDDTAEKEDAKALFQNTLGTLRVHVVSLNVATCENFYQNCE